VDSQRFDVPIPKGMRIYVGDFAVAGLEHRMGNFRKAFRSDSVRIGLVAEKNNRYDRNAIAVVALKPRFFFGEKQLFLGYVPKEYARQIIAAGVLPDLLFRLRNIWRGDSGRVNLYADLLGPKDKYENFRNA
jgi:hypothetical protein